MSGFEDLNELKTLRTRGVINEDKFNTYQQSMARRIIKDRKELVHTKNGLVYLFLAYFAGAIGLHNFYAGYYKRGGFQLFLTLIAFYMYYLPLLAAAGWAFLEFMLVNHSANGARFRGHIGIIWLWRIVGLTFLAYQLKNMETGLSAFAIAKG